MSFLLVKIKDKETQIDRNFCDIFGSYPEILKVCFWLFSQRTLLEGFRVLVLLGIEQKSVRSKAKHLSLCTISPGPTRNILNKNEVEGCPLSDFKTIQLEIIKIQQYYVKYISVIKDREIDRLMEQIKFQMCPYIYGLLIFNKHEKAIQWRKDSLLNKLC